jgi:catechol 2,3-dioxygenase-like lactoylglutathione lyase family enzyme
MIKLAGIGHVLLRVADEERSKRFYRDVLGFQVAEQDPEHGGVFMTLGDGFHALDITQHGTPEAAEAPHRGQIGLASSMSPSRSRAMRLCATPTRICW